MCSEANLLIPGCGEGKYSIYCRVKQGKWAALERSKLPDDFQGRVFKDRVRERVMEFVLNFLIG